MAGNLGRKDRLLSLEKAGVRRDGRWLVHDVDLTLDRGEIVTLIGPNGSGKSTTAKLSLGLIQPDSGSCARKAGLTVGYLPQRFQLDWTLPLSVKRLMSLTNKLNDKACEEALGRTGVAHLAGSNVQALSGGELQRVLLARAIARKPDLLVLDEPVQGVDFSGEIALYRLIAELRNELDCGILLISHDLHLVMAETDQVLCLNGHVCCVGPPKSVAGDPEYLKLFGPRAASALAVYQHHHDHTHLPDGRVRHADGSITDHCHPEDGHHHEPAAESAPTGEGKSTGEIKGADHAG